MLYTFVVSLSFVPFQFHFRFNFPIKRIHFFLFDLFITKKYFFDFNLPEYEKRNLFTQHVLLIVCVNIKQLITKFASIGYILFPEASILRFKIPTDKSNFINPILCRYMSNAMNKWLLIYLHRRKKERTSWICKVISSKIRDETKNK